MTNHVKRVSVSKAPYQGRAAFWHPAIREKLIVSVDRIGLQARGRARPALSTYLSAGS